MIDAREKLAEAADKAKQFNRKPPQWAYWVLGITIILGFLILRSL